MSCVFANETAPSEEVIAIPELSSPVSIPAPAVTPAPLAAPKAVVKALPEAPFRPFTGKVKAKKVRVRVNPDLESSIVKEVAKNDLIAIVGEKGDFWAVEPLPGTKAYVFRSFILDNVVEGNRVNVRLKPDLEAPVIGHLGAGEKVSGIISSLNNKWLEIAPPSNTRFYIAKDFVENIGGPEVKVKIEKRKSAAKQLLEATDLLSKAELKKPYHEIDIERFVHSYQTVVKDYADFPDYVTTAKDALASIQETYLQKKISYLEAKAGKKGVAHDLIDSEKGLALENESLRAKEDPSDRMKMWEPIEEALYLTWAHINGDRNIDEYYNEQNVTSVAVSGIVETYAAPVKNKPGDFILRDKDTPVAYLYSTKVNLQNLVGKKVTLIGTPRPNNNFAFPAFYVLDSE
jgi:uncharacterized protein YgiM (DUF1202 family)